jgi:hypothetical protein
VRLHEPLIDLLTREENVGPVREHGRDLREAVARERARVFEAGNAGQRGLDAEGDLLFDFERRQRRCPRVDLNLVVGDIRHRVDREARRRPARQSSSAARSRNPEWRRSCRCLLRILGFAEFGLENEAVDDSDAFPVAQPAADFDDFAISPAEFDGALLEAGIGPHEDNRSAIYGL